MPLGEHALEPRSTAPRSAHAVERGTVRQGREDHSGASRPQHADDDAQVHAPGAERAHGSDHRAFGKRTLFFET
jgi:hypothetical protein